MPILSSTIELPRDQEEDRRGFFMAGLLAAAPAASDRGAPSSRQIVVLMDTSLSMQWERLERSFQAVSSVLPGCRPAISSTCCCSIAGSPRLDPR